MPNLSNPIFYDEAQTREWREARVWANERNRPHRGAIDQSTLMKAKTTLGHVPPIDRNFHGKHEAEAECAEEVARKKTDHNR